MTTLDLIGKILQVIAGLAGFAALIGLLLVSLDTKQSERRGALIRTLVLAVVGCVVLVAPMLIPSLVTSARVPVLLGVAILAIAGVLFLADVVKSERLGAAIRSGGPVLVVAIVLLVLPGYVSSGIGEWISPTVTAVFGGLLVALAIGLAVASLVGGRLGRALTGGLPPVLVGVAMLLFPTMYGDDVARWLTPGAATTIGAAAIAVGVVTALVELAAPGRIARHVRLIAMLALAALFVVLALTVPALGAWPYAGAMLVAVVGLLLYLAAGDDESKPMVAFLVPAAALLAVGLLYPAIRTTMLAFTDNTGAFIGLENFVWMFTQRDALITLANTVAWVILVPLVSTVIGLAYAVFIDKSAGEKVYKMLVFLPMAISFVGAGIIWRFMYAYRGGDREQFGLVNQIIVWFGGEPQQLLQNAPWNTVALIVVMIWIQTGFAMTVLSAAIKGIAVEQLEAAELDGASPWQRFWNVTVPGIRSSLVVVVTTISIATLKVFDIVRTMTAGNFDTSVVANEMYTQAFRAGEPGRGAALALILFLLVLPIVIYNVRVLRRQREIR